MCRPGGGPGTWSSSRMAGKRSLPCAQCWDYARTRRADWWEYQTNSICDSHTNLDLSRAAVFRVIEFRRWRLLARGSRGYQVSITPEQQVDALGDLTCYPANNAHATSIGFAPGVKGALQWNKPLIESLPLRICLNGA